MREGRIVATNPSSNPISLLSTSVLKSYLKGLVIRAAIGKVYLGWYTRPYGETEEMASHFLLALYSYLANTNLNTKPTFLHSFRKLAVPCGYPLHKNCQDTS